MTKLSDASLQLRRRYVARIPAKVATLSETVESLGHSAHEAAKTIRGLAHQIAGSAASYGFAELGVLAQATELADPTQLEMRTRALIAKLEAIYDQHGRELAPPAPR